MKLIPVVLFAGFFLFAKFGPNTAVAESCVSKCYREQDCDGQNSYATPEHCKSACRHQCAEENSNNSSLEATRKIASPAKTLKKKKPAKALKKKQPVKAPGKDDSEKVN